MDEIREVKKSFCALSVAYIVLGLVLLIWPDISVRTFCYVFGVGMIIFGLAHLIIYFTKDRMQTIMQMDMVAGIVGLATGAYILIKMEYMLEIIPFALAIVALLGAVVKLQNAFDLRRLRAERWYVMLLFSAVLFVLGLLLIANPFDGIKVIVILIGVSLIMDGVGNLLGIFWIGHLLKHMNEMPVKKEKKSKQKVIDVAVSDEEAEEIPPARVVQFPVSAEKPDDRQ